MSRMLDFEYRLRCQVWQYAGPGGWHFVTLPRKTSAEIKSLFGAAQRGWGSLPVMATIGRTSWKTSIFADKKAEAYLLPLKADVRRQEKIVSGGVIAIRLQIKV